MIIVLKPHTAESDVQSFVSMLENQGVQIHQSKGVDTTILGVIGDTTRMNEESLKAHHLVSKVMRVQEPYKMANRAFHPDDTIISVKSGKDGGLAKIGLPHFAVMAGPCSVESEEQISTIAAQVQKSGARFLRGGALNPYIAICFSGYGMRRNRFTPCCKKQTGLPIVTELMAINQLEVFENVDIIQIGARNMQNFNLLKELGRSDKPILLKEVLLQQLRNF